MPLTYTGNNQDIVVDANATTPYSNYTTASMDAGSANSGNTWYEQGLPGGGDGGLPMGTSFLSQDGSGTTFALSASNAYNAVLINDSTPSVQITFNTPLSLSGTLAFATSSGNGGSGPSFNVTGLIQGGGTVSLGTINSPDWFGNSPVAYDSNGRVDLDYNGFDSVDGGNPNLYDETINLAGPTQTLTGLQFDFNDNGNGGANTAIMAISGTATPEPATLSLLGLGAVGLLFRRRRA